MQESREDTNQPYPHLSFCQPDFFVVEIHVPDFTLSVKRQAVQQKTSFLPDISTSTIFILLWARGKALQTPKKTTSSSLKSESLLPIIKNLSFIAVQH